MTGSMALHKCRAWTQKSDTPPYAPWNWTWSHLLHIDLDKEWCPEVHPFPPTCRLLRCRRLRLPSSVDHACPSRPHPRWSMNGENPSFWVCMKSFGAAALVSFLRVKYFRSIKRHLPQPRPVPGAGWDVCLYWEIIKASCLQPRPVVASHQYLLPPAPSWLESPRAAARECLGPLDRKIEKIQSFRLFDWWSLQTSNDDLH